MVKQFSKFKNNMFFVVNQMDNMILLSSSVPLPLTYTGNVSSYSIKNLCIQNQFYILSQMGHDFVKFFSSCFTDLLTILEVERALMQYLELDLYSFSYPPKLRARNKSMIRRVP